MIELSNETLVALDRRMDWVGVEAGERGDYRKWVRFYLDFCEKHGHPPRNEGSLEPFLAKLASKNQSEARRRQAALAVRLLLGRASGLRGAESTDSGERPAQGARREGIGEWVVREADESFGSAGKPMEAAGGRGLLGDTKRGDAAVFRAGVPTGAQKKASRLPASGLDVGRGASWANEYRDLEGAIKMRNYSAKTFSAYRLWVQKFQAFVRSKPPGEIDGEDTKRFLTDLAVRQGVAGSTQNQAFNALLFFFRHVLGREFGKLDGVVRAKRRPYVPVVLSRAEVDAVLGQMDPPYRLVGTLLYGCGLRLMECLELRIHCLNLDAMLLTVHDGKGQKDRSVPLPKRILSEIKGQMEAVRRLHKRDLSAGYAGTFLPGQLEKKYKNAAREFIWQWFFPAATLTSVGGTGEMRRYHLHDSHVQGAVKRAAGEAGIPKRVTPHTFRHTFASHLLMAGYDLQTIQKLLGHGDVKTTMIYLQTVPDVTLKQARSPLDLPA